VLLVHAALRGGAAGPAGTVGPVTPPTGTTGSVRVTVGGVYVRVRKGDTLGSIAARAGTSVARLERLNPGVSPTALQVGQRIRVK
jgi:lipoprotein NlpD